MTVCRRRDVTTQSAAIRVRDFCLAVPATLLMPRRRSAKTTTSVFWAPTTAGLDTSVGTPWVRTAAIAHRVYRNRVRRQ